MDEENKDDNGDGVEVLLLSIGNNPIEFGDDEENKLLRKSFCSVLLTGTAVVVVCLFKSCLRAKCLFLIVSN